jgi:hypothetical protein
MLAEMTLLTEICVVTGERYRVQGDVKDIESAILAAARGSIMELAWMVDQATGESIGINPEFVVLLRTVEVEG